MVYSKENIKKQGEKTMTIYTSIHNHNRTEKSQELRRSNAAGVHTCTISRSAALSADICDNLESFGFSCADDALDSDGEKW